MAEVEIFFRWLGDTQTRKALRQGRQEVLLTLDGLTKRFQSGSVPLSLMRFYSVDLLSEVRAWLATHLDMRHAAEQLNGCVLDASKTFPGAFSNSVLQDDNSRDVLRQEAILKLAFGDEPFPPADVWQPLVLLIAIDAAVAATIAQSIADVKDDNHLCATSVSARDFANSTPIEQADVVARWQHGYGEPPQWLDSLTYDFDEHHPQVDVEPSDELKWLHSLERKMFKPDGISIAQAYASWGADAGQHQWDDEGHFDRWEAAVNFATEGPPEIPKGGPGYREMLQWTSRPTEIAPVSNS